MRAGELCYVHRYVERNSRVEFLVKNFPMTIQVPVIEPEVVVTILIHRREEGTPNSLLLLPLSASMTLF